MHAYVCIYLGFSIDCFCPGATTESDVLALSISFPLFLFFFLIVCWCIGQITGFAANTRYFSSESRGNFSYELLKLFVGPQLRLCLSIWAGTVLNPALIGSKCTLEDPNNIILNYQGAFIPSSIVDSSLTILWTVSSPHYATTPLTRSFRTESVPLPSLMHMLLSWLLESYHGPT